MSVYSENGPCPKCGCMSVGTRYRCGLGGEVMFRTCARCSYQWSETPLDAKDREPGRARQEG